MKNRILKLLTILILLQNSNLFAQVYYFKKYTTTDGLVQGTVKTIYQDSRGRMWFGTAEGVSIYDGTEFSNFGIVEGFNKPVITSFYEISPGIILLLWSLGFTVLGIIEILNPVYFDSIGGGFIELLFLKK